MSSEIVRSGTIRHVVVVGREALGAWDSDARLQEVTVPSRCWRSGTADLRHRTPERNRRWIGSGVCGSGGQMARRGVGVEAGVVIDIRFPSRTDDGGVEGARRG